MTETARRAYYCIVTLQWFERHWPRRTVQKTITWSDVVNADPRSDRKRLAQDVIEEAKRHGDRLGIAIPNDAAVLFLSIEPNTLAEDG